MDNNKQFIQTDLETFNAWQQDSVKTLLYFKQAWPVAEENHAEYIKVLNTTVKSLITV